MGRRYVAVAENLTLTTGTDVTVVQVAAGTNHSFSVTEIGVTLGGKAVESPVEVTLLRQSSAGTGGTGATEAGQEPLLSTAAATALTGLWSSEPSDGNVLRAWKVSPNGGALVVQFEPGRIVAGPSGRLALSVEEKEGSATAPTCSAYVEWDEQ